MTDPRSLATPALKRTFRFLRENWCRPITVMDLVAVSRLSTRGLARAFNQHVGHGPGKELRRMRIESAQLLLAQSDWSLKGIAFACGFRSVNSFWVAFRRENGKSPGQYRKLFRLERPPARSAVAGLAGAPLAATSSGSAPETAPSPGVPRAGKSQSRIYE